MKNEEKKFDKDINVRSKDDTEIDVGMIERSVEREKYLTVWLLNGAEWESYSLSKILALIHRLQDDYSNLKERYVKVLGLNEKVISEQKAEIERLSFYKTVFDKGLAVSLVNMQETIDKQKAEIERLTEERDGNKFNSGKYNRALESLSKERRLNAELQKQVDDKKAEEGEIYEWAKKNMLFGKGN